MVVVTADHAEQADTIREALLHGKARAHSMAPELRMYGDALAALDALVAALAAAEQRAKDEHASFDIATSHYRDEFMRAETAEARADALARRVGTLEAALTKIASTRDGEHYSEGTREKTVGAGTVMRTIARAALAGEEGADE